MNNFRAGKGRDSICSVTDASGRFIALLSAESTGKAWPASFLLTAVLADETGMGFTAVRRRNALEIFSTALSSIPASHGQSSLDETTPYCLT